MKGNDIYMSDTEKITLQKLKNTYKQGVFIPEIQRDYVMGAGGKLSDRQDKLEKLLDAILASCKEHKDFDFSCIITYCEDPDNGKLQIYDGQQRLTTLFIMLIFKLRKENNDDIIKNYQNWYSFSGRESANHIIRKLTNIGDKYKEITEDDVVDFSSFSMLNLWNKLKEEKYEPITSEYLLNQVKFDMVSVGSQSEIEQFFMDLNSGVKLKDYELYKAKLVHHISTFHADYYNESIKEALQEWPHKMDNEWLNFFDIFADFYHTAEEYEIEFIKYCIRMTYFTERIEYDENNFDGVNEDIILKVYKLIELVSKLDFFDAIHDKNILENVLQFSWGNLEEQKTGKERCNYDKRGAFWNLQYQEHDKLLYYVIKNVLIKKEEREALYSDVILWCFITTLDWKIDVQNEYLRIVKIILNHNVEENHDAWYECQGKGQYLYYCKYNVYGIPQYYGKHINLKTVTDDINNKHSNMFLFNKWVIENITILNVLNRKRIAKTLMDKMKNTSIVYISEIINFRIGLLNDYEDKYDEYIDKENEKLGILEKIKNPPISGYYLGKVRLSWPTRGKNSPEDCLVRLKCNTDLLFETFDPIKDSWVSNTCKTKFKITDDNIIDGADMIDKCFWPDTNKVQVHKLINRVTNDSTTYNKNGSDSRWKHTWNLQSNDF